MDGTLNWEWFVRKILQRSGIDLNAYKRPQMQRRINSFMRSVKATNYGALVRILETDPQVYHRFIEHLTINVSEFFRNNNHWEVLRREILPELVRKRGSLRTWSAGCSTGEEPYSLAIMLKEYFPGKFDRVLATDIDTEAIEKAKNGLYSAKALQQVSDRLLKKYFERQGQYFHLKDEIKRLVKFQKHDLLKDAFPADLDLVLCRNVVIYFTEQAKDRLYRKFVEALRPGGVLFIGSTEQVFRAREMGLQTIATFFYKKDEVKFG